MLWLYKAWGFCREWGHGGELMVVVSCWPAAWVLEEETVLHRSFKANTDEGVSWELFSRKCINSVFLCNCTRELTEGETNMAVNHSSKDTLVLKSNHSFWVRGPRLVSQSGLNYRCWCWSAGLQAQPGQAGISSEYNWFLNKCNSCITIVKVETSHWSLQCDSGNTNVLCAKQLLE